MAPRKSKQIKNIADHKIAKKNINIELSVSIIHFTFPDRFVYSRRIYREEKSLLK